MSWATKRLDELGRVVTGKTPATTNPNFYGGELMFVKPSDMEYESYYVTNTNTTVTDQARDSHRNQFIPADAVMFTCIGNTIGKCGISSDECITNQQINSIVVNGENNPKFIYYLLNRLRPLIRGIGLSGGAAQPIINKSTFSAVKVRAPDKRTQDRIADILSAYDDLIENNRRRIALLEEAARLLYREWFVHFRFPGHELVKIIAGLPEGWERRPVSRLADIFRGKSYRSSELVDSDGQPFVNLKCVDRFGGFRVSGLKWFRGNHKEHHLTVTGDVLIAVTDMTRNAMIVAQAARVPMTVGDNAIYSMDLVKAIPRTDVEPEWLYGMLRFSQFSAVVREEATGATVLHLKPSHIENREAVVPPPGLRGLFSEKFGAILQQVDNLEIQNANCAKARDLLLPRLMNGETAV